LKNFFCEFANFPQNFQPDFLLDHSVKRKKFFANKVFIPLLENVHAVPGRIARVAPSSEPIP
jgi:hypothetical protein